MVSFLPMVDTHCHLDLLEEEELRQTLQDKDLEYLITVGYDRKTIGNALRLAEEHHHVYCAVGFHPHEADKVGEQDFQWLKEVARHPKVRALGEMGLDYYKNYSDKKRQEEVFRRQISIARELGLPIVVHSREAEQDTLRILKEEKAYEVGGVMHCFTGSLSLIHI
ncbi:MAG: TatD family hydrolase, partial [Aquificaceae bacterium]|nr:TatD family hydrolase [Aquificaceae bacterium]